MVVELSWLHCLISPLSPCLVVLPVLSMIYSYHCWSDVPMFAVWDSCNPEWSCRFCIIICMIVTMMIINCLTQLFTHPDRTPYRLIIYLYIFIYTFIHIYDHICIMWTYRSIQFHMVRSFADGLWFHFLLLVHGGSLAEMVSSLWGWPRSEKAIERMGQMVIDHHWLVVWNIFYFSIYWE